MKNNQKGFANIFLIIVILAVVGVAGYVIIKKLGPVDKAESTSTAINETADWKTYTDTQNGFEIKYPIDWYITDNEYLNPLTRQIPPDMPENSDAGGYKGVIEINLRKNPAKLPLRSFYDSSTYIEDYFKTATKGVEKLATGDQFEGVLFKGIVGLDIYNIASFKLDDNVVEFIDTSQKLYDPGSVFAKIISTFKFISSPSLTSEPTISPTEPLPVIDSISPVSGPKGITVDIIGKNLSGFEGDLIATFKRSDGREVTIKSLVPYYSGKMGDPTNTTLIRVKIEPPCQAGQTVYADYSGNPYICDDFAFTPGVYEVYINPWTKKSNKVKFTVTD